MESAADRNSPSGSQASRLSRLGVRPEDLEEHFIRSSGPGGQNVNKVSTCVVLRHIPTGIIVRCQQSRSQAQNRVLAREVLAARIEEGRRAEQERQNAELALRRRLRRRRPAGVQERLIESKRLMSRKKALRRHLRKHTDLD